ncbi:MAG: hypothetical protein KAY37_09685 [Phycisphaerae bacterium]|nr:hypothetical protein [Phycisphaerae bacterium]
MSLCLSVLFSVALLLGVPAALAQEAIIIDHNCTDLSQVPAYWIDQAKLLTIHYAHTSHGSQVNSGAELLETIDPFYSFARRASGTEGLPPIEDPPALRMYDGNPPETYIQPNDYWEGTSGQDRTRAVADTGHYNYSMWSWCGQVSGADQAYIQYYLDTMTQFETEYPAMRFILMTGHTDGSGEAGNLNVRNNQIRAYALANNKVLFDFADIESWDPDGNYFLDLGCTDNGDYNGGNWCFEWCTANPGSDLCVYCDCAHSHKLICNLKGRAFWWMMARLAGWPGPDTPPECLGDSNCDNQITWRDIDYFVAAMNDNVSAWYDMFLPGTPTCSFTNNDVNEDGTVSWRDIDPFVNVMNTTCP